MAKKREDRRIRRTKRLLRQALAELMNEKEFKDITVKEITERADLNRGTFYFHYTDTYDLKDKIENELVQVLQENLETYQPTEDNHSVQDIADAVLGYIQENRFLVRTLFHDTSGEGIRSKMMRVLEDTIYRVQTTHMLEENDGQRKYVCRFLANGIVGAVTMWLEQEDSLEGITVIIDNLICRIFPVEAIR
ncbi:MAG: TetR/AcrR family transcriptional regulator [Eubacteriales bacterium]|nr:TetR/AcrR family transcriptional regulator [Eubacteriales bacterium]